MLVLFGMKPHAPATGYGYIHAGEALPGDERVKRVAGFVEKPDRPTAERYLASGEYFWNSGIFLMSAKSLLGELARHEPQILAHAREALGHSWRDGEFLHLGAAAFEGCPSLSIDYAVMERTQRAAVVPADFGWTDVGSWSTLWEMAERDASGNMLLGDVLTERTRNSYIRSEGPLIATIGVEDLIVVATDDAVLIAHKSHDQEIKKIVERLRARDPGRI
jgi:mannose-1-phosphate guanylyltransferase/mannose-1-phosphate guanylyltransferase/mannose-6-phosphate isomerase